MPWAVSGFRREGPAGSRIPLDMSEAAAGVWHLPIIVVGALLLFRLALVLRHRPELSGSDMPGYPGKVMAGLGAVARIIAIAAPLLALAGKIRRSKRPAAGFCGVIAGFSLAATLYCYLMRGVNWEFFEYVFPVARMWEYAIGICLGFLTRLIRDRSPEPRPSRRAGSRCQTRRSCQRRPNRSRPARPRRRRTSP